MTLLKNKLECLVRQKKFGPVLHALEASLQYFTLKVGFRLFTHWALLKKTSKVQTPRLLCLQRQWQRKTF